MPIPCYIIDRINDYIKEVSTNKGKICVLVVGSSEGSTFTLDYGKKYCITVIDISSYELNKDKSSHKKILGDIQSINFQPSSFDVIVCIDVLEHLASPEKALKNFPLSLKDGGIIILGLPNVMSLKGLITKFTPYRFHRWIWKYIYKSKYVPFPTYHKWIISPEALRTFAKDNNLSVLWFHLYDLPVKMLRSRNLLLYTIYFSLGLIVRVFTFGKVSITKTECVFVYRKK